MKDVNIFTEDRPGWILRRGSEEIKAAFPEVSINGKPRAINYSINYALFRDCEGVRVGNYTHLEETGVYRERFLATIEKYHWFTCMSDQIRQLLISKGAPEDRVKTIRYGSDDRLAKKVLFGVVGRTYASHRKGEWLVSMMVDYGFNVAYWGQGWPCREWSTGSDWDILPAFYEAIDYLVVTARNEGGPIPVIDAIAAGVPVIAPKDVGWCGEFPIIEYENSHWESLHWVLESLTSPPTWKQWTDQHAQLFEEIRCSV